MPIEHPEATAINGVIYQYTVDKNTPDDLLVHIQNEDTQGSGYIFRETDDWSGQPSSSINKLVVLPNLPASRFGEGSIETEGTGTVSSASIVYSYRLNPDLIAPDPIEVPDIPQVEIYDALEDENVDSGTTVTDVYDDQESSQEDQESSEKESLEDELSVGKSPIEIAGTMTQVEMLQAINLATNINTYYAASIEGGVYKESVQLVDSDLPDNKRGLRNNLAQQALHTKMVDMQWR